jgi:hypothetical protein
MFSANRIASLSPIMKARLHRRLISRAQEAADAWGEDSAQHLRACAVLGRFAAL